MTFGDDFARGDGYVNVLGASIAPQCIEAGELDEIFVGVVPLLLGEGTQLFDFPGDRNVKLERISLTHVPQAMNLWFRVIR